MRRRCPGWLGAALLGAAGVAALAGAGCESSAGDPLDEAALGYQACATDRACGVGRYCRREAGAAEGVCWADCRRTEGDKDCAFFGTGLVCSVFGQCVSAAEDDSCLTSADCDPDAYCNQATNRCETPVACDGPTVCAGGEACAGGRCTPTCGTRTELVEGVEREYGIHEDCPEGRYCNASVRRGGQATCSPSCRDTADCSAYNGDVTCVPLGLCLEPGVDWYEPDVCRWEVDGHAVDHRYADSACLHLGWTYACRPGGCESSCEQLGTEVDFGEVDPAYPASQLVGVWGAHFQTATISEVPMIGTQNAYSSNTSIVRLTHVGDQVTMEIKICNIELINFWDDDQQHTNLSWVEVPTRYYPAVPVVTQEFEITSVEQGAEFVTSYIHDVRGAWLEDPYNDPLPTRAAPAGSWDQDEDGSPGMTTVMQGMLHGDLWIAQRWGDSKHGVILDDHDPPRYIGGLMEGFSEQNVLGANPPDLGQDAEITMHPMADRTFFRMERGPDDLTCADLLTRRHREGDWLSFTFHYGDVPVPAD